ncbi:MAG: hypothetical protein QOJ81_2083 [Chloroflexota bacterium]|jgi:hypothetical protein|nr:hypothetical protein [Chloroflexota bacterium]
MYESYGQPMISRRAFLVRLAKHFALTLGLLGAWLLLGMLGYAWFGHLKLVDAFLNAAMIAGGMGPVDILTDDSAKIFAGVYAIVSGVVIIGAAGVTLAPVLHRVLHALHLDEDDDEPVKEPGKKPDR